MFIKLVINIKPNVPVYWMTESEFEMKFHEWRNGLVFGGI